MQRSLFVGILSLILTTGLGMAAEKVDISQLPSAVQRTINKSKGQGEVKKVTTRQVEGATVYEVDYKEGADETRIRIRPDGAVIGDDQSVGNGQGKGKNSDQDDRWKGKKGKGKAKGQTKGRGQEPQAAPPVAAPATTPPAQVPATPPVTTPQPPTPTPVERPATRPQPAPRVPAPAPTKPTIENGQPSAPATAPVPPRTNAPAPRVPQPPPASSAPESAQPATPAPAQLDSRVRLVNGQDTTSATRKVALAAVSKETGVSVTTLERDAKRYAVGVGGVLVAHDIAKRTKKPASTYFLEHVRGVSWDRIAADAKVDIRTIVPKLDRVQQTIQNSATDTSTTTRKRRSLF